MANISERPGAAATVGLPRFDVGEKLDDIRKRLSDAAEAVQETVTGDDSANQIRQDPTAQQSTPPKTTGPDAGGSTASYVGIGALVLGILTIGLFWFYG